MARKKKLVKEEKVKNVKEELISVKVDETEVDEETKEEKPLNNYIFLNPAKYARAKEKFGKNNEADIEKVVTEYKKLGGTFLLNGKQENKIG